MLSIFKKRTSLSAAVTIALLTIIFSFQNCARVQFNDAGPSSVAADCFTTNCTGTTNNLTCSFNGQSVAEGQSISAYLTSTVAYGSTCTQQTRTCQGGVLSGSYSYASCSVGAAASCLFNGQTIAHGQSVTAYLNSSESYGTTCSSEIQTCNNGSLSGVGYQYSSCSVGAPKACLFDGQTIPHGGQVVAYQTSAVGYGSGCNQESRVCNDGSLSGSFLFGSCSVAAPKSCLFNGQTVAHGANVISYQSSSVGYGSTCNQESRVCNDGNLSGSFQYPFCSPSAPLSCDFNGVIIPHGSSVTAYASSSVSYGQSCSSQTRSCNNGVLDGTNQYSSCSIQPVSVSSITYLVVGGGGGSSGGGAGGGAVLQGTVAVTPGTTYTITVGNGGAGSTSVLGPFTDGGASSLDSLVTAAGGHYESCSSNNGYACAGSSSGNGNTGYNPNGSMGPNGGGGGAGGASLGQAGGVGVSSSITGSSVTYGTGGTGCTTDGNCTGGSGVGGANTGDGAGGPGGNGGSGVVIVQYANGYLAPSSISGNYTDISASTPGYRTYKFTGNGTITF